jgi:hypothetical protein
MPNTGIRSRSKKRASDLHEETLEPFWNLSPELSNSLAQVKTKWQTSSTG